MSIFGPAAFAVVADADEAELAALLVGAEVVGFVAVAVDDTDGTGFTPRGVDDLNAGFVDACGTLPGVAGFCVADSTGFEAGGVLTVRLRARDAMRGMRHIAEPTSNSVLQQAFKRQKNDKTKVGERALRISSGSFYEL